MYYLITDKQRLEIEYRFLLESIEKKRTDLLIYEYACLANAFDRLSVLESYLKEGKEVECCEYCKVTLTDDTRCEDTQNGVACKKCDYLESLGVSKELLAIYPRTDLVIEKIYRCMSESF